MRSMPRRRSRVDTKRRSFWPSRTGRSAREVFQSTNGGCEVLLLPFPRSLSRQDMSRIATIARSSQHWSATLFGAFIPFHSNPSWSLKNSLKAGSSSNDARSFGACSSSTIETIDLRLSAAEDRPDRERHICAKRPSSCRRPFLILIPSREER